jgi:hypothetical protein
MQELANVYYTPPVESLLERSPKQVYKAALATVKTLGFIGSIKTHTSDEGEMAIYATGEIKFFWTWEPVGLYIKISPRDDRSRFFMEIYSVNVKGLIVSALLESFLRRRYYQIERSIFNYLRH